MATLMVQRLRDAVAIGRGEYEQGRACILQVDVGERKQGFPRHTNSEDTAKARRTDEGAGRNAVGWSRPNLKGVG